MRSVLSSFFYCFILFVFSVLSSVFVGYAQQEKTFLPEIRGTVRGKFEYQPDINKGRFGVRNARFGISGYVTEHLQYKSEVDLSDEGRIRMLDAYVRLNPIQNGRFTIGQMRVPFTIDAHRSPHEQYFANRSFIAKQVGNVRDVGAAAYYKIQTRLPIILEAGIFNGSGLYENKNFWTDNFNFTTKLQLLSPSGFNLTLSMQKSKTGDVFTYMYNGGMYYHAGPWHLEAEYMLKKYEKGAFPDMSAVDAFICYDLPVRRLFKKISFLCRYDYMGDHSNGIYGPDRKLQLSDAERHRATAGLTFSLAKPFVSDIRINYEKYFYSKEAPIKISEQDKIVVELMTRF
ncbi:porin [Porphyromonas crevioricanis]|uniref:porin n=1 Tax=Porphyromonas crevioricanis TaxID=393921 RepID=UPI00068B7832|nr:porin [Porphyromonas crevioricanis]